MRKRPAYEHIAQTVRDRIRLGFYEPGQPIPSEASLGGEFGVSRPTVVRALEIVTREGWLRAEHGRGRYVTGDPGQAEKAFTARGARAAWQRQMQENTTRLRALLGASGIPARHLVVIDTVIDQLEDLMRSGPQLTEPSGEPPEDTPGQDVI